jgi:hypothetical protein
MSSNQSGKTKTRKAKTEETALETLPKVELLNSRPDALINPGVPYSKEWKDNWLKAAADAEDMAEACAKAKTTITDYLLARTADLEFDAACLVFDQIVDLRITDTVRRQAAEGTVPAQGVYFKSVRRPAFAPGFASWKKPEPEPELPPPIPMPARVADAMVKAGLAEFEMMNRPPELSPNPQLPKPDAVEQ